MLSKLDDYPIHQISQPVAQPASSDRHVYDRYWFNGYQDDGAFYIGIGAALYPNLRIMDCGVSLVIDGEQHSFHASRRAPVEPTDLQIGPFKLNIIEPMKRLRVTVDENDTGFGCDLEWIPRTANIQESHQESRNAGTVMQATRFNQFGYWSGEVRYDGKTLAVDPKRVYGTKDRSWGIRPVGDPAPMGAPPLDPPGIHFLWLPLHWEDRCTHIGMFQNTHGEIWHFDGMICPVYGNPDDIPGVEDPAVRTIVDAEHSLEFVKGTRRASAGEFTLIERGGNRETLSVEPLLCYRMKGIGYSHPEWGHGKWKGELAIGGEKWKCADVDNMDLQNQHIQQVVRVRSGSKEGIGVLEQIHMGPHPDYGFKDFLDPA